MLKLFLTFLVGVLYRWVLFRLSRGVDRVFFLEHALWDADAVPFWPSVVHSVHQLTVPPDVLGVGVAAIPIGERGLLSDLSFALEQLSIP